MIVEQKLYLIFLSGFIIWMILLFKHLCVLTFTTKRKKRKKNVKGNTSKSNDEIKVMVNDS